MIRSMEDGFAGRNRKKLPVADVFKDLYWHIKSGILFARGLMGKPDATFDFNIETLVSTLNELEKHIAHPLYPFVATWNQRLWDLAGKNFEEIRAFREAVLAALQGWILVEGLEKNAAYFSGLKEFRRSLEQPLRIFSLNYDRCVECLEGNGDAQFRVEQGFGTEETNPERIWNWRRMQSDLAGRDNVELRNTDIFLYKLHGSIDWIRDENEQLKLIEPTEIRNFPMRDIEIIFGKEAKLDARDPFSFYFSEFRRACKTASVVVAIGYSFADPHVNQILAGALQEPKSHATLVVVTRPPTEPCRESDDDQKNLIAKRLAGEQTDANRKRWDKLVAQIKNRIHVRAVGAEAFLRDTVSWKQLSEYLPKSDDPFA